MFRIDRSENYLMPKHSLINLTISNDIKIGLNSI